MFKVNSSTLRFLLGTGLVSFGIFGCGWDQDLPSPEPGVSWELARKRAEVLSDLRYELDFSLPESTSEPIRGRVGIEFALAKIEDPLVIDFDQPAEGLIGVKVGDRTAEHRFVNGHIVIPAAYFQLGANRVSLDFWAGDGPLNRNPEFLYTLFVPDRAAEAFPCFNQPNLKASYRLTLRTPESWTAVSNSLLVNRRIDGREAVWEFGPSKPISSYLFSFAAGKFLSVSEQRSGRTLTMLYREPDAEKASRNRTAIFDLHETALNWLENYTGIPYPFEKFDFILIPDFQYGGMEHPAAILYREASLMLDESATQNQLLGRASLIAHETAHMWFGNLVTMNWFDDVWTKEVFANFMAAKIVNPSFPEINHELRFLLAHYPDAYEVDRSAGANPIRQRLENLREAGSLYGAIIYEKAPIVMKHLELLVGETPFRDGLREYLKRFSYANATWPQLIEILDATSKEDLKAWSQVWVEESGRPTIRTEISRDAGGRVESVRLLQSDEAGRGLVWNQRLQVLMGGASSYTFPVKLDSALVEVSQAKGLPRPQFVLANGKGVGYGHFELDPDSQNYLLMRLSEISDPVTRGAAWMGLWEALLYGRLSGEKWMDAALRHVSTEGDELNAQRMLNDIGVAFWRFLEPETRNRLAPQIERQLWRQMEKAKAATLKATFFTAFRNVVLSDEGLLKLRAVWRKELKPEGLSLAEQDYYEIAAALALRGPADAAEILDVEAERIKNPDRRVRFEFVRPALSQDSAVRGTFFESLKDLSNRRREPWVLEGLRYLHHPLRARDSEKFILPSLEMLEEIHRTGDIFFPKRWLDVTLGGHRSKSAADTVTLFLREHPELPSRLRGKLLQSADPLFRAARLAK